MADELTYRSQQMCRAVQRMHHLTENFGRAAGTVAIEGKLLDFRPTRRSTCDGIRALFRRECVTKDEQRDGRGERNLVEVSEMLDSQDSVSTTLQDPFSSFE